MAVGVGIEKSGCAPKPYSNEQPATIDAAPSASTILDSPRTMATSPQVGFGYKPEYA
jgi:hypothetical protein